MPLTLKLLQQVVTLGEAGNFARAADQLGISQPTLSRNVASLEAALGMRLFDRAQSGVAPTAFGELLMRRGPSLLRDAQALQAELRAVAGLETGRLHIVAGPFAAEDLVGPTVARLVARRPRLQLRLHVVSPDQIGAAMLGGRFDLGFGGVDNLTPHDSLSVEHLLSLRLYLGCRPGHALVGTQPSLHEVLSQPMVTTVMHGRNAQLPPDTAATREDPPRSGLVPSIEVNSIETARQVARHSDALFPGTRSMLAPALAAGQLVTLDFDHPAMRAHYAMVRVRDRTPSPAAAEFIELMRGVVAETASGK